MNIEKLLYGAFSGSKLKTNITAFSDFGLKFLHVLWLKNHKSMTFLDLKKTKLVHVLTCKVHRTIVPNYWLWIINLNRNAFKVFELLNLLTKTAFLPIIKSLFREKKTIYLAFFILSSFDRVIRVFLRQPAFSDFSFLPGVPWQMDTAELSVRRPILLAPRGFKYIPCPSNSSQNFEVFFLCFFLSWQWLILLKACCDKQQNSSSKHPKVWDRSDRPRLLRLCHLQ